MHIWRMNVQKKCQVVSSESLLATKKEYFFFLCKHSTPFENIQKSSTQNWKSSCSASLSLSLFPFILYSAFCQSLLCLMDMATLQSCDSHHVPYYIFVCSCVESREKKEILKV